MLERCASTRPARRRAELEAATRATSSPRGERRRAGGAREPPQRLARLARERGNLRVAIDRLLRAGDADGAWGSRSRSPRCCRGTRHRRGARLARAGARRAGATAQRGEGLYWDGQLAVARPLHGRRAPLEAALEGLAPRPGAQVRGADRARPPRRAHRRADAGALCEARSRRRVPTAIWACSPTPCSPGRRLRARQDWPRAAVADEALKLFRAAGDPYGVAEALGEQGYYDCVHGRLERAERRLREALELRRKLGDDRRLVEPLIDNAWLDLARESAEVARHGFVDCLGLARHVGDEFNVGEALAGLSASPPATGAMSRRRGWPAPRRRPRADRRAALGVRTRHPRARAGSRTRSPRRQRLRRTLRRGPPALARRSGHPLPPFRP